MPIQHTRSSKLRLILAFTMALVAAAFSFANSSAHAYLVRSEPSDGLVLPEAPVDVRLWFDEPVSGKFSSAQLIDPNGQPIELAHIRVDPAEPNLIIISLPELSPGAYSLLYKALSETDGHFSQGLLVFGVGEETDLAAARAVETAPQELPPLEVGLRWLNFTALAGVVGAMAIAQWVLGSSRLSDWTSATVKTALYSARKRVVGLALGFCVLGLAVGIGLLLWQMRLLMDSLGEAGAITVSRQLLGGTRWGHVWILRQLGFLLLLPLLIVIFRRLSFASEPRRLMDDQVAPGSLRRKIVAETSGRDASLWPLVTTLALALVIIQSLTSHASGLEDNAVLAIVSDALHLLAAGLWVGGLLAMVLGLGPLLARQRTELAAIIRAGWKPFSFVAVFSVVILFATGFYSTGRQIASIDALLTTPYGRALIAKIAAVLFVGAMGLLNSMLLHPRLALPLAKTLRRPAGWTPLPLRRLPTLVVVEASVGVLVLLLASVVTASPAPRGIEYAIESEEIPGALSQAVDDLIITLNVKPNRPGQNAFNVFARSTRRPPPAQIARVLLRFDYLDRDIGRTSATAEKVASDRFILAGNHLNLGGEWRIQVVVRRLGLEDSVATFNWLVVPPGEIRPTVVSRAPLEPAMTLLAAALLLLVAITIVISWIMSGRFSGTTQVVGNPQEMIAVRKAKPSLAHKNGGESGELTTVAQQQKIFGDDKSAW